MGSSAPTVTTARQKSVAGARHGPSLRGLGCWNEASMVAPPRRARARRSGRTTAAVRASSGRAVATARVSLPSTCQVLKTSPAYTLNLRPTEET